MIKTKKLKIKTPKTTSANWKAGSGASNTLIGDYLEVETRFNIDGYIKTGLGTSDDYTEQEDVMDKKADLNSMFEDGGVTFLQWGNYGYNVNFEKVSITEEPSDEDTKTIFSVKMTVVVGWNR